MNFKLLITFVLLSLVQNLYSQEMRINYTLNYKSDSLSAEKITKKNGSTDSKWRVKIFIGKTI